MRFQRTGPENEKRKKQVFDYQLEELWEKDKD